MLLDDTIRYRKTEACTFAANLGREEWIVDAGQIFRRDPLTGILHLNSNEGVADARAQRQHATALHRVTSVQDEVQENLLQFSRVAAHNRKVRLEVHDDAYLSAFNLMPNQRDRLVDYFVDIDLGIFDRRCSREV